MLKQKKDASGLENLQLSQWMSVSTFKMAFLRKKKAKLNKWISFLNKILIEYFTSKLFFNIYKD